MNRRNLLAVMAATLPTIAVSSPTQERITNLHDRLAEAGRFYEDNISFDAYKPYFNGVLAGYGGLNDWVIDTTKTGAEAGHIVDIAVQFDKGAQYVHFPIRFSSDYWQRNPL